MVLVYLILLARNTHDSHARHNKQTNTRHTRTHRTQPNPPASPRTARDRSSRSFRTPHSLYQYVRAPRQSNPTLTLYTSCTTRATTTTPTSIIMDSGVQFVSSRAVCSYVEARNQYFDHTSRSIGRVLPVGVYLVLCCVVPGTSCTYCPAIGPMRQSLGTTMHARFGCMHSPLRCANLRRLSYRFVCWTALPFATTTHATSIFTKKVFLSSIPRKIIVPVKSVLVHAT